MEACLYGALEHYGREMTAEGVAGRVLEDRTFYTTSGGGCTVSGGEPLLQAGFCAELFGMLQRERIHCAIDTSGAVSWDAFETVLPCTDLFLYDVKHADDRLHLEHTGGSNRVILANLQRLSEYGTPIEIRIPTIPGFNADMRSMVAIGEILSSLANITGVRLLPYHLARFKYEVVGRPDTMPDVAPPDSATVDAAASALRACGLKVID